MPINHSAKSSDAAAYLYHLQRIETTFDGESVKDAHLNELPIELYGKVVKFIRPLLEAAGLVLDAHDNGMLENGPTGRFQHRYLDRAYQLYLADQLVETEAQWSSYQDNRAKLINARGLLEHQITSLHPAARDRLKRKTELRSKLDSVDTTLKHISARMPKLNERTCALLNVAYSRHYSYGHLPVKGLFAPKLDKDYSEDAARDEWHSNEFHRCGNVPQAIQLRTKIFEE